MQQKLSLFKDNNYIGLPSSELNKLQLISRLEGYGDEDQREIAEARDDFEKRINLSNFLTPEGLKQLKELSNTFDPKAPHYYLGLSIPGTEILEEDPDRFKGGMPDNSLDVQLSNASLSGETLIDDTKTERTRDPRQSHLEYGLELEDKNGEKIKLSTDTPFEDIVGEDEYRDKEGRAVTMMVYKNDGTAGVLPVYEGQFGEFASYEAVSAYDWNGFGDMEIEADWYDFALRGANNFLVGFGQMLASIGAVSGHSVDQTLGQAMAILLKFHRNNPKFNYDSSDYRSEPEKTDEEIAREEINTRKIYVSTNALASPADGNYNYKITFS